MVEYEVLTKHDVVEPVDGKNLGRHAALFNDLARGEEVAFRGTIEELRQVRHSILSSKAFRLRRYPAIAFDITTRLRLVSGKLALVVTRKPEESKP